MNNNVASLAMNLNVFRLVRLVSTISEKSYWPAGEFITFDWMAWPEQIQAARYTSSKQRQYQTGAAMKWKVDSSPLMINSGEETRTFFPRRNF